MRSMTDEGLAARLVLYEHTRMAHRHADKQLSRARRLRRDMTAAEAILWRTLRDRGIGAKFRRQVPIGPYIADFVCVSAKLIIELDGPPHDDPAQRERDMHRDKWFLAHDWRVLRFQNDLVIGGGNLILEEIRRAMGAAAPPSSVTLRVPPSPA